VKRMLSFAMILIVLSVAIVPLFSQTGIKRVNSTILKKWGMEYPVSLYEIAQKIGVDNCSAVIGIEILHGENIHDFHGLEAFSHLKVLHIEKSKIESLITKEKNNLEVLSIIDGRLKTLDGVGCFENLISLSLNGNPLVEIKGIQVLSRLHELNVSRTNIGSFADVVFPSGLELITMRENNLKSLFAVKNSFLTIKELDVSINKISSLDDVDNWGSLKQLDLWVNPVMERYRDKLGNLATRVKYKTISLVFEETLP
jgi:Leucine-rich repeat (LRR) protein